MPEKKEGSFKTYFAGRSCLVWAGWVLLLGWAVWWGGSFAQKIPKLLARGPYMFTMPRYEYLGVDFIHNYAAVHTWQKTGNPYGHLEGDPMNVHYLPAPPTLVFFSWALALPPDFLVKPVDRAAMIAEVAYPRRAIILWFIVSVAIFGFAAFEIWKVREALGLSAVPVQWLLLVMLVSYPVMFELERGNFNVLVLLFVVMAGSEFLRSASRRLILREITIGICAAFAAVLKIFPFILLPGLIVLRRYVAAVTMLLSAGILLLAMFGLSRQWAQIVPTLIAKQGSAIPLSMHSLSFIWNYLWHGTMLENMSSGIGALLLLIFPPAAIVGGYLFLSPARDRLMLPFLLWLAALGTCAMMVSVDYNLLFLVVATLLLWDRRDPLWLKLALIPWLLVWQPLLLVPEGASDAPWFLALFLGMKFWSLLAVGGLLIWRGRMLDRNGEQGFPVLAPTGPERPTSALSAQ